MPKRAREPTHQVLCPGGCLRFLEPGRALSSHISRSKCRLSVNKVASQNRRAAFEPDEADQWPTVQLDPNQFLDDFASMDGPDLEDWQAPHLSPACILPRANLNGPSSESMGEQANPAPTPQPRIVTVKYAGAGKKMGRCHTAWEELQKLQVDPSNPQSPFWKDDAEWAMARWMVLSGLTRAKIDKYLFNDHNAAHPLSFRNARALFKRIEALPSGPQWKYTCVRLPEADDEPQTLYYRNIIECVDYLLGHPAFHDSMQYTPYKEYVPWSDGHDCDSPDAWERMRVYNEMLSADKVHEVQLALPSGTTVIAVILGSDATHTSNHSGDRKAHPVYLSLGNLPKALRAKTSKRAFVLLALLPIPKWKNVVDPIKRRAPKPSRSNKKRAPKAKTNPMHGILKHRLFHACLSFILNPIRQQGTQTRLVNCGDGYRRSVMTFLAAYISDLEEQWVVACMRTCPQCTAGGKTLGESKPGKAQEASDILATIQHVRQEYPDATLWEFSKHMAEYGLMAIDEPFWEALPFFSLTAICCDTLHGLHKFFKDHIFQWCNNIAGPSEIDARYKIMPHYSGRRVFSAGVSHISQWSGKEHRDLQRYALAACIGVIPHDCILALRSILDFIYFAQLRSHTAETLKTLETFLANFHKFKNAFINAGGRLSSGMNIPKLHALWHYIKNITSLGTTDGYSTETPEHLHIEYIKDLVQLTNGKGIEKQIIRRLDCIDRVLIWDGFISWTRERTGLPAGKQDDSGSDNDSDNGDLAREETPQLDMGLRSYWFTKRAHRPSTSISSLDGDFVGLIYALIRYLARPANVDPYTPVLRAPVPTIRHLDSAYHIVEVSDYFYRQLPQLDRHDPVEIQKIRARFVAPSIPGEPRKFQYDSVFVDCQPDCEQQIGVDGLRVAQLRLLFRPINVLPTNLRDKEPRPNPNYLALVEWFHLAPEADRSTEFFACQRAYRSKDGLKIPAYDVVNAANIVRLCPLVPAMTGSPAVVLNSNGEPITASNSLEYLNKFYVNSFHCKFTHASTF